MITLTEGNEKRTRQCSNLRNPNIALTEQLDLAHDAIDFWFAEWLELWITMCSELQTAKRSP